MRKRTIIVTAVPLIVAGIVGASAFVAGHGTADATAQAQVNQLAVSATVAPSPIVFGDHATVTVTGSNTNVGSMKINAVTLSLSGGLGTCPSGSFTLGNTSPAPATTTLAGGATNVTLATTMLSFVDLPAVDQSSCDSKNVTVHAVVS